MHPVVEQHRDDLARLCEEHGVERLELFGSVCTGAFDPEQSDIDVIASFADRGPGYADRYFGLAESLESLFARRVDVVTPYSIQSPHFRESVEACRQVIYERSSREAAA